MSHPAIVRSSARMAQQKANESQQEANTRRSSTTSNLPNADHLHDQLSQLSVISVSSSEGGDVAHEMNIRKQRYRQASEQTTTSSTRSTPAKTAPPQRPMTAPLDHLSTFSDIEACLDSDLSQIEAINRLEEQWHSISSNFETVLDHLQECSDQVTEASNNCLESLVDSIEATCDSVDGQVKALYHLMTRCDELTTKLSAASSFRDEIKTLRKSVDTLENLYRSRPQASLRRSPANQSINP